MAFINVSKVTKEFKTNNITYKAVDDISLTIDKGEFVILLGDSGAGKSTLLNMLGGLDFITAGDITVDETSLSSLNEKELTLYRRDKVGFVFQFYNLMSSLTVRENIEIIGSNSPGHWDIDELLSYLGLLERKKYFPAQMSGGEQQRVAIARAMYKNPSILLCDEPTGALDYINSKNILALIQRVNREKGKTVVMVTHNNAIDVIAHKVVKMKSGKIRDIIINENPTPVEDLEW